MPSVNQTECFEANVRYWKYLGIWPSGVTNIYYKYYMIAFIMTFCVIYDLLLTVNFFFIPRQLDSFIEEMIFYFTELAVFSKVATFFFLHKDIEDIMKVLQSDTFQPNSEEECKIIGKAGKFNLRYYNIVAVVSVVSWVMNNVVPFILHFAIPIPLKFPVCSYLFVPDDVRLKFQYPLYIYQSLGMYFHVYYNVTIDTFFLGLMIYIIAQLDILDLKLKNITEVDHEGNQGDARRTNGENDKALIIRLNHFVVHFDDVGKFCSLIQKVFGITLFVQFSMASTIICVCLFRFVLPAPIGYYIFLATYMFIMIIQILVPCWFGTRIIDKSNMLGQSLYDCNWTSKSRIFKMNMRLFIERTIRPLTIIGWKMFPLSLKTFTAIINTAYSFFTVLRHMQSRQ